MHPSFMLKERGSLLQGEEPREPRIPPMADAGGNSEPTASASPDPTVYANTDYGQYFPNLTPDEDRRLLDDDEHEDQASEPFIMSPGESAPISWRVPVVLLLLAAVHPLAFEIIYPFINQMIVDIGVVKNPERVGFYSGLIDTISSCVGFITVMPVSYLADRIGRKPVVLGGITGVALSIAWFGMSRSFSAMVLSRSLGGALGSTSACYRIMVGEQIGRTNQASAFQWLGVAYRVGQVIGLPLGGFLAHPARRFKLFQTTFWYEYPFFLPCFVASVLALSSVVIGYYKLQETLPLEGRHTSKPTYIRIFGTALPPAGAGVTGAAVEAREQPSVRSILTPSTVSLLASNIAMSLTSISVVAVFPLFAFTPIASGGLGLSEAAIGTQLAIRSILQIIMLCFYAPLEQRLGTSARMYRTVIWIWPLAASCAPLLNYIARRSGQDTWLLYSALFPFLLIWSMSSFAWTSFYIMVTDAAPSAGALATINGLSQMTTVLPEVIAPALVTSLFAFSIESGIAGGNLIWIIIFALACAAALHAMTLREPTSDWRKSTQAP